MGSKKAQTVGYKYYASAHLVLCHGPVDAITKITVQDKEAFSTEKNSNQTIYINKPNLFGGDESSGGIVGNVDLLFGYPDQQKSSAIAEIVSDTVSEWGASKSAFTAFNGTTISSASTALISAWRGITSVVFKNVYVGTSPTFPESKWRVKRIHTLQNGEQQWYDEKAEVNSVLALGLELGPTSSGWKYRQVSLSDKSDYSSISIDDSNWATGTMPFASAAGQPYAEANGFPATMGTYWALNTAIWLRRSFSLSSTADITLDIFIDNVADVWVNGTQLVTSTNTTQSKITFTIPKEVLNVGENIIVMKGSDDAETSSSDYTYAAFKLNQIDISEADLNPAHIIREYLTNTLWGKGTSSSLINDESFKKSADTLFTESMGMSIAWSESKTGKEFVDNVLEHINGELYVDRLTGFWNLMLIRDDYDVDTLVHLTESLYKKVSFKRRTLSECVNQVTVTYYDRERSKNSTQTIQDIGRISQQNGVVSQNVEYLGFSNSAIASRVALRDLKTLSAELASIEFDVDESDVENWHKGYVFKFSNYRYGLSEAVFRVTEIKFGDGINNTVSIKAVEDSFSSPMQAVIEYLPPTPNNKSAKDALAIAFEVPYIELVEQYGQDQIDAKLSNNPDLSFVGLAAVRPNNFHINASLYSDAGAGFVEEAALDFCPSATLKADIGYLDTSFEVENISEFELLQANNRLQIDDEFVAFVSFDSATNILTVKRGVADTVPAKHLKSAKIYGWDSYSGLDKTEYSNGETVAMKALTLTGSDILTLSEATAHSVKCVARAIRPYPPANVKIGGEYYPTKRFAGSIEITWVDRNRLQQTGSDYIGWTDSGVTLETGVTYTIVAKSLDGSELFKAENISANTYSLNTLSIASTSCILEVFSVRDGFESFQKFRHTIFIQKDGEDFVFDLSETYIVPNAGNVNFTNM